VRHLVYPIISYNMPFWHPLSTQCEQLEAAIAWPLRSALRLPRSSSTLGALADFGLLPIQQLWQLRCLRFGSRALHLRADHPTFIRYDAQLSSPDSKTAIRRPAAQTALTLSYDFKFDLRYGDRAVLPDRAASLALLAFKTRRPTSLLAATRSIYATAKYLLLETPAEAATRALYRHNRLRTCSSLYQLGLADSAACPRCDAASETIQHVLLDCPAHDVPRQFGKLALLVLCHDFSVHIPFDICFLLGELATDLAADCVPLALEISRNMLLTVERSFR
jgi:hypothetical protein